MTHRKKLIEVALPLKEINEASAREKSIRHGHPSTLHLWWARRPLATCRAVLFASIIDDPGEEDAPQELLKLIDKLPLAPKYRELAQENVEIDGRGPAFMHALQEKLARERRYRLFTFIERLVQWENSNDEETLRIARELILAATDGNPPPVLDPFCGGGSIPLEAQRLGLEAHASDLNPVAVLITKAMIEIPPKFAGWKPVNPDARRRELAVWNGAQGLAEDVRYYGKWMRDEAEKRIGHLYPKVKAYRDPKTGHYYGQADVDRMWEQESRLVEKDPSLFPHPSTLVPEDLTVIAWLWARTATCPNPACRGHVPLVRSFWLSTKAGKEAWLEAVPRAGGRGVDFAVRTGEPSGSDRRKIDSGTGVTFDRAPDGSLLKKPKRAQATFLCPSCCVGVLKGEDIDDQANGIGLGAQPLAVVAEGARGRLYLPADQGTVGAAREASGLLASIDQEKLPTEPCRGTFASNAQGRIYGFRQFKDYFTDRQLVALTTFSDLVGEASQKVEAHAISAGLDKGSAVGYAAGVQTYLSFALSKMADRGSTICTWFTERDSTRNTFARQAIPMTWDFAELNVLLRGTGSFEGATNWTAESVESLPGPPMGGATQLDARSPLGQGQVVSTDPPYFDNIGYADLSDFFYVWLRRSLKGAYPDMFSTLLTPKTSELIASPYRHERSREKATGFFETGLHQAFVRIKEASLRDYPTTIYYAFKQAETEADEANGDAKSTSTGWESMLQGMIDSGFSINGTWPTRTELSNRMVASGTNALASCIVLVCRPRAAGAPTVTRREFVAALRQDLPPALEKLTQGNIAPVDLEQAAIGPGMAVFSRYSSVLESDGKPMRVRTALGLINQALDEALAEQEGWYDPQTRWAVTWFKQRGFEAGPYGEAEVLATAKSTPVRAMEESGIVRSGGSKVGLLSRDELSDDYDPVGDERVTIWSATQRLVKALDSGGELLAAKMLRRYREARSDLEVERARDLAYRLYTICNAKRQTQEQRVYDALVRSWTDIEEVSRTDEAAWSAPTVPKAPTRSSRRAGVAPTLEGI